MFAKVIVGFDGSEQAHDALALSEVLTAADGELLVCCVHRFKGITSRVDPAEPRLDQATAERSVQAACGLLHGPYRIVPLIVPGAGAAETLKHNATKQRAELLVLGSSHRGPVGRVLAGSVTEEVLHTATCPVAVAPSGFRDRPPRARPARIVLGYDVAAPPLQALKAAAMLASHNDAELELIAVADTTTAKAGGASAAMSYPAIVKARLDAAEKDLSRALGELPRGVRASGTVRDGRTSEELLEVTHSVDLLVLGSRGRGLLSRFLLGSVSDTVARGASCPVLVVPSASAEETQAKQETGTLADLPQRQLLRPPNALGEQ